MRHMITWKKVDHSEDYVGHGGGFHFKAQYVKTYNPGGWACYNVVCVETKRVYSKGGLPNSFEASHV